METQIFEPPTASNSVHPNQDQNDSDIFNALTQMVDEPINPEPNIVVKKKRFAAVMSQSSQPANTPEWSIAARVSSDEIEQFQHARAELEAAKKKSKLKKHRFLFATSSDDEDEEDDDLEFDLPKRAERIPTAGRAEKTTESDNLKRRSSQEEDDADESTPKKAKRNTVKPAKITTRQLSVRLSRDEVRRHIGSKKSSRDEPSKVAKHSEIETIAEVHEPRNLRRRRKSHSHGTETSPSRQSKRPREMEKMNAEESAHVGRGGGRRKPEGKEKVDSSNQHKDAAPATRSARKKESKENQSRSAPEPILVSTMISFSSLCSMIHVVFFVQ